MIWRVFTHSILVGVVAATFGVTKYFPCIWEANSTYLFLI